MVNHIPLNRQFFPVPKSEEEAEINEIHMVYGLSKPKFWDDMDREFRCVILAEAGAGKTEEFRQHAGELASKDKPAFFIRIEDIEDNFYNAFEIGEKDQFQSWLNSSEEAWFFLDSVDEARLDNPRTFKKAICRFAKGIKKGAHRAHIYLSSRPYAWRPTEDRKLLDEILLKRATQQEKDEEERHKEKPSEPPSALTIYIMRHLDKERIQRFCKARSVKNVDGLLREIERYNLWSLAERPFDLEGILAKWNEDNTLGSRLDLLSHNIDKRLQDDHSTDRAQRQLLNLEQAREGARRLAAAVVLTGQAGLNVPDASPDKPGIEAKTVLADWNPQDVHALLLQGIFNDIIYGAVRFRHRDVREFLAAEWFNRLLQEGDSRYLVEELFFRVKYGEKIITPRLRSILPWLLLFDEDIRRRALMIHPEIVVEGGDPSRLPFSKRKEILVEIVQRIVSNEDDRAARDNSAIARIANPDLSDETMRLINKYSDNDDAIFYLGRLVWLGEMRSCVEPFIDIALDGKRGIYARRVSARAVMTRGSAEQKIKIWKMISGISDQIPRELLAEMLEETEPDSHSVKYLLISLGKLTPYTQFETSGLGSSLHEFVRRLPINDAQSVFTQFLDGVYTYLERPPFVEGRECLVSKEYAWLLNPATHAVERLVEKQSSLALSKSARSIMLMVPTLIFWQENDHSEYKNNLHTLVPDWPELNDALYWACIEQARTAKSEKSDETLIDDRAVSWLNHFWNFDTGDLPRLLEYMRSRKFQDDRLVALSTAFQIYVKVDRPAHILSNLQDTVADDPVLRKQLEILLKPPVSEPILRYEEDMANHERERKEKEEQETQHRNTWIAELQANPDRVQNPPNLKHGEFTKDHYWLMVELAEGNSVMDSADCKNWQALIPDFGETVAHAYRDAAVNHWRHYSPSLQSEGAPNNSTPFALIFAMAGIEIEAIENPEFPNNLNEEEVRHALRYITWELNRFPSWLERMYQEFPKLVEESVINELLWELKNTDADKPMHYILHDLVYYAPWLHASMAPVIMKWIKANPTRINTNRNYCLEILVKGGTDAAKLAELANQQINQTNNPDSISWWYAIFVCYEPINGIPELAKWLSGLNEEEATNAAQIFITTLMGSRHLRVGDTYFSRFRKAEHLKSLYILMHRYIRAQDDINRAEGVGYTPQLRDDAQDARNRLFNLLTEIPGKASYISIKQLAKEHPEPNFRPWMAKHAYKRAEEDGDLEPWTAEQVSEFDNCRMITPTTHRQLFDLAVYRLRDMKNWLERGNDSPWKTWQRAQKETEMRNLIAGWLNQQSRGRYKIAQEPELANSQRMDIWLQNTNVRSPVPIELKLLDKKSWNGPKLCERLRNQLAGDYLREETAGCGVMLLVWQGKQGKEPERRWEINGHNVGLGELENALKQYWESIADDFPGVDAIEVIVIDLTQRAQVSNS